MSSPMKKAVEKAAETMRAGIGGPFGAAVTDAEGNVIAVSSNRVLGDKDPTAHAEITAIREACAKLGTHDLTGCTIYATGFPCPMCLGAIIWSNIRLCYYGNTPEEAEEIGFRDDFIYDYIKGELKDETVLELKRTGQAECKALFDEYHENCGRIY